MTPLLKKLNFKAYKEVVIINPPEEFSAEMDSMRAHTQVVTEVNEKQTIESSLCFVSDAKAIVTSAQTLVPLLKGDAILWFAYPKGTSKKYKVTITRDKGWEPLGKLNFEPVRAVSIDDDWSALRFRNVDYIKSMSRRQNFAMTEAGKKKTSGK